MKNQIQESLATSEVSFWTTEQSTFGGIAPIDHLFNRLDGIYVGKWRAAFSNDSSIKNWREAWSEAICEEKLTQVELKYGIRECKRLYDWPPSFTEFLKACRPTVCYETAFYESQNQLQRREKGIDKWTDPAIFWAATSMTLEIKNNNFHQIKGRWKAALDQAREDVRDGTKPNQVPEKRAELASPGKTTVSKEESEKRWACIFKVLESKVSSNKKTNTKELTVTGQDEPE